MTAVLLRPPPPPAPFFLPGMPGVAPPPPGAGPDGLEARVREADAARAGGFAGNPHDEDVADPLGMPLESYRAVAWELDESVARLVDGLFGALPRAAEA